MAATIEGFRKPPEVSPMLLLEFFDSFYALRPKVRSERTRKFYRNEIAKLERVAGGPLKLSDLSEALLLKSCQAQLKLGRSLATIQKHQTAIRALWAYARRKRKNIGANVPAVPELERWPQMERAPECWSLAELSKILQAAAELKGRVGETPASVFWLALLLTCYETGGRISAVMALRLEDVDAEAQTIVLRADRAKDKADSKQHVSPELVGLLSQIGKDPKRPNDVFGVWPFDRTRPDAWPALNNKLGKLIEAAGLPNNSKNKFHKLRRTFATQVCSKAGEAVAQTLLGHSSLSVTRRYLDRSKLSLPKANELLERPVFSFSLKVS